MSLYPKYGPASLLKPPKKPPEKIEEKAAGEPEGGKYASNKNSANDASSSKDKYFQPGQHRSERLRCLRRRHLNAKQDVEAFKEPYHKERGR